jgi:transcriptional regulator with XRE-family HTH domain
MPIVIKITTIVVMEDWKQKLGRELRRARKQNRMTQKQLREALKTNGFTLSLNSIGHYERGERAPDFDDLRKIAMTLRAGHFEIDEEVRIEFNPNGKARLQALPQQLSLELDTDGGVNVRIESAKNGLVIKKKTWA